MNCCYNMQRLGYSGAMDHSLIQQKNGPLTTEIAILNLIEIMAHSNFNFIDKTRKMSYNMVYSSLSL